MAACDNPVVVADCVSKSTLRVAMDEVLRLRLKDVYYFPSFEILRWLAPMVGQVWLEDKMISHVKNRWIDYVMSKFMQFYCFDEQPIKPPMDDYPD